MFISLKNIFIFSSTIIIFLNTVSCDEAKFNSGKNYKVTEEYIKGSTYINNFTISELEVSSIGGNGLPIKEKDIVQYCCKSSSKSLKKKIYFNRKNKGYKWFYCTLNLDFIEVDSLKKLSEEQKLTMIHQVRGENMYFDTIPFRFEAGKWYHLYGLENVEGSYYIHFNIKKEFIVKYFEGGPF
ncbi:MAG: hypothetical protein K9H64_20285 [Bacteroidales bacterium]|nr:hypothetical protein [Bacteroidales bacterium]MCF8458391.1 hypothetical protein [Bacteroidales bacterium]